MWKQSLSTALRHSRLLSTAASTTSASSTVIDNLILRSLREHYLELSKMSPPPKINPPPPYSLIKGALQSHSGPVLKADHNGEEIKISVMRLSSIVPGGGEDDDDDGDDAMNQLFLHVDVSKIGGKEGIQFLCGLYPDAVGIHSVSLRPMDGATSDANSMYKYRGRVFQELDEKVRDAFHIYIEERGVNEKLFPFLQAWLYVKHHQSLMRWFKTVGTFISEHTSRPQ